MTELPIINVETYENRHGYWLDGVPLSGITTLIHNVKRLGVYPNRENFEFAIRKAGVYGTAVHHAIEMWDKYGVEETNYIELGRAKKQASVETELYNYIRSQKGFTPVGNEYIVRYGDYASAIDNVWENKEGIYLVDTKTCNIEKFPNGKNGLMEYLSWQLSCYAYMFERQTGLTVAGLKGNWFKKDKHEQWDIERVPDSEIVKLLNTPYDLVINPDGTYECRYYQEMNGKKVYYTTGEYESVPEVTETPNNELSVNEQARVYDWLKQIDELNAKVDEFKAVLLDRMTENDIKKFECDYFTITRTLPTVRTAFDAARFKADYADLYEKYTKTSNVKSSIKITLKKQ